MWSVVVSSKAAGRFLFRKNPRTDDFESIYYEIINMLNVFDTEVPLNKNVKTNIYETEADSCLKAFLTDSSLHTDTLVFTLLLLISY